MQSFTEAQLQAFPGWFTRGFWTRFISLFKQPSYRGSVTCNTLLLHTPFYYWGFCALCLICILHTAHSDRALSPDLWFIDFAPQTDCAEVPGSSHLLSVITSSISLFLYFLLDLFYGQFLPQRMLSLLYTHSHLPALPLCVSSWGSTGNSNRHSLALHSTSSPKAHSTYSSLKGFSVNHHLMLPNGEKLQGHVWHCASWANTGQKARALLLCS